MAAHASQRGRLIPPLPAEAVHLPFEPAFRMQLGLTSVAEGDLFEIDDRYPDEMAERRDLLARRHTDVFAACPGSEAARAETLERVAGVLAARFPGWFARDGHRLQNRLTNEVWDLARPPCDPLELAGRLVQEDLCLIDPSGAAPVLTAAVLCAPSRWRLAEKIGRPLADVHAPVPLYAKRLSAPVDRLMRHIGGKPVLRMNWSVVDDPALFQQGGKHRAEADPAFTRETVIEQLNLRMERQTLSRLPGGTVLFTIRVHSYPLRRGGE